MFEDWTNQSDNEQDLAEYLDTQTLQNVSGEYAN